MMSWQESEVHLGNACSNSATGSNFLLSVKLVVIDHLIPPVMEVSEYWLEYSDSDEFTCS